MHICFYSVKTGTAFATPVLTVLYLYISRLFIKKSLNYLYGFSVCKYSNKYQEYTAFNQLKHLC